MADQIDSVSGGGNGFALISFTNTQINFSVPPSVSFDVYISGTYVATSTQPDGAYEGSLAQIKAFAGTSPATISFEGPDGASAFTVTWSDPLEGYATTEDVNNTLTDYATTANINNTLSGYVTIQGINSYIEQWWNNEVRPELEAINTTLVSILEQLTPVVTEAEGNVLADQLAKIRSQLTPITDEAQNETLADQFARLRYLADPDATEVDSDEHHGTGIISTSPYWEIYLAAAFKQLIVQGGILSKDANAKSDEDVALLLAQLTALPNEQLKAESLDYLQTLITQAKDSLGNL